MPVATALKIRCDCGTPVLELTDQAIILTGRHHGQTHTTIIPLSELGLAPQDTDFMGRRTVRVGAY